MAKVSNHIRKPVRKNTCKKCGREIRETEFCDPCFIDVAYKRLRKYIRINALIRKDDQLVVLERLTPKILSQIINKPVKVEHMAMHYDGLGSINSKEFKTKEFKNIISAGKKIIVPSCLDDIELHYLRLFFKGQASSFDIAFDRNIIPLYLPLTKEELFRLAKLKHVKIALKNRAGKDGGKLPKFLDRLEKEFPGTKFHLRNSIMHTLRLQNKSNQVSFG